MNAKKTSIMLTLSAAALALAGTVYAAEPVKPFVSMIPNNIFSATNPRRPTGPRDPGSYSTRTVYTRIPAPLLTGVVIDEKEYVAFIEENGRVTLARVNQKLPQGTITEITLFGITLNPADGSAPRKISVGQNLAPDRVIESVVPGLAPAPESAGPGPAGETPKVETPAAPTGAVDPVIEAMKAKRAAEMGGTPAPTNPSNPSN